MTIFQPPFIMPRLLLHCLTVELFLCLGYRCPSTARSPWNQSFYRRGGTNGVTVAKLQTPTTRLYRVSHYHACMRGEPGAPFHVHAINLSQSSGTTAISQP